MAFPRSGLVTLAVVSCLTVPSMRAAEETWAVRRQRLGTEDPYRILVDKVLSLSTGWKMQPAHVAEIKEAGFNVIVPRIGADDDERVRRVARMAAEHGLFYMPWIRGTRASSGPVSQRATGPKGRCGNLASPNSEALWSYWRDRVLFYARLSREQPSVMGVFLDFENYDKVQIGGGMCYTLSYDEEILLLFAADKGLKLPDPLPEDRGAWVKELGKTDDFREYQIGSWRDRCRVLRREVDAINPQFQFVVYPAGHSPFIKEAVWREWHTAAAPLVMAEVETYWRTEVALDGALKSSLAIMQKRRAALDQVDSTIRYMAGLDPVVSGASPEFEGKSAVMGTEASNGYWVFYEGPVYGQQDHTDYFAWFKRANDCIERKDYSLWQEPAETPNQLLEEIAESAREIAGEQLVPLTVESVPAEALKQVFTHRPKARYQVLLRKGERLTGELTGLRHAHITSGSAAVVVTPSGETLGQVMVDAGMSVPIDLEAPEDGVYGIAITSGRGKGRLRLENRYVCIVGPGVSLVGDQPPAFVAPRPGTQAVDFSVSSPVPGEHVQVTVRSPAGDVVLDRNTLQECPLKVNCETGGKREGWRLDLKKAVEDITVEFGATCEPRMATHPGRLLVSPAAE